MAERYDGIIEIKNERMCNYQIIPLSNYHIIQSCSR